MAGGRPSKLTPEVQKRLCDAVSAGNYYEAACEYAGVDYSTFRRWMEQGEAAKTGVFREFCDAVKKADADAEVRVVAQWRQHMPDNWQACRDFLARRYPARWSEKTHQEITGPGGGPIEVRVMTDEQRAAALNRLLATVEARGVRPHRVGDADRN